MMTSLPQNNRTGAGLRLACLLTLPFIPSLPGGVLTFDGTEYTNAATAIGVNDSIAAGSAVWTLYSGASASITTPSGNGVSGRSLRLTDSSTTVAQAAYLDTAGTATLTAPFTVAFDIKLTGTNATTGTLQAWVQFGRTLADAWGNSRDWLHFDFNGADARLWIYDATKTTSGYRTAVTLGTHAGNRYYHVSATIDPVTRRYLNVMFDGVDVTNKVATATADGGTIPWRIASGDDGSSSTTLPNALLWAVSGTDDVVTVDLDNVRIDTNPEPWIAKASDEWLSYLTSSTNLKVGSGSALDLSGIFDRTEAGINSRGFAQVDQDGELSFADGTKARLFAMSEFMPSFPLAATASDTDLQDYVDQVARAGYNAYRPHFLDVYLMENQTTDLVFNSDRFTQWQKLAAKLRAKGIYLLMDTTTSWNAFYSESPNKFYTNTSRLKRLKVKLCYDQATRDHWKSAVEQIYNASNSYIAAPYLGLTDSRLLKNDPQVLFNNLRNEPALYFQLLVETATPALSTESGLIDAWHAWLPTVYASVAALNTAWGSGTYSYAAFADVPLPNYTVTTGVPFRDLRRFEVDLEQDTFAWMQQVIRDVGVKSLLSDLNNLSDLPTALMRDTIPLIDSHTYQDHPADGSGNVLYIQTARSAVDDVLQYVRSIGQSRHAGRPFTVTEWGHVFWNPYRYEGGLMFPSYARLQGWSAIAQHARQVQLAPFRAEPFEAGTDPIAKATEYMAALLYGRADVAVSPHHTEVVVDAVSGTVQADTAGFPYALKALPLVTRFGLRVNWPAVVGDTFDDVSVATADVVNDSSLGTVSAFWNTYANGTSTVTAASGKLALKATGSTYPSAMLRTQASATGSLDFFTKPMQFSVSGPVFTTDSVPANEQVFRFVITPGTGIAYGNAAAIVLEIRGDNQVRLGYKVGSANAAVSNWVEAITDLSATAGTITGFTFNPMASDLNAANPGGTFDPTYDLVINLSGSGSQPLHRRYTGRWGKNVYTALTPANWGTVTANTVQCEAQKLDGLANAKYVTASLDKFTLLTRPVSPQATAAVVDYTKKYPSETGGLTFAGVVTALKAGTTPVLDSANLTVGPTSESPTSNIYVDGVYHSDTKELLLQAGKRAFRLITPRSEGTTLPVTQFDGSSAPATVILTNLKVTNQNAPYVRTPVGVLLSSLSSNPARTLQNAEKLLLVVAPDALNSNMAFTSYKRTQLYNNYYGQSYDGQGALPVLLRRASVTVKVRNVNAGTFLVYPLNQDGSRRAAITASTETVGADTWLVINIDTGTLPGGPAMFFEIVTTSPVASALEAWRFRYFGIARSEGPAADDADPDGDGVANLLEYAQGTVPVAAGVGQPVSVAATAFAGGSRLALTFVRDRAATGVTLAVEAANVLTEPVWSRIDPELPANQVSVLSDMPGAGLDTYTIRDSQPLDASPQRFMRLRATPTSLSNSS